MVIGRVPALAASPRNIEPARPLRRMKGLRVEFAAKVLIRSFDAQTPGPKVCPTAKSRDIVRHRWASSVDLPLSGALIFRNETYSTS